MSGSDFEDPDFEDTQRFELVMQRLQTFMTRQIEQFRDENTLYGVDVPLSFFGYLLNDRDIDHETLSYALRFLHENANKNPIRFTLVKNYIKSLGSFCVEYGIEYDPNDLIGLELKVLQIFEFIHAGHIEHPAPITPDTMPSSGESAAPIAPQGPWDLKAAGSIGSSAFLPPSAGTFARQFPIASAAAMPAVPTPRAKNKRTLILESEAEPEPFDELPEPPKVLGTSYHGVLDANNDAIQAIIQYLEDAQPDSDIVKEATTSSSFSPAKRARR